ncbi:asialoglycoprotein receptor-like 1 [Pempheris klunzingeri]|uniref:asialoglycoprotein receptor-like 1 n=1 Tax=Pempheris klunzingeri TaxID=3127111 RepID=UPI00397EDF1F
MEPQYHQFGTGSDNSSVHREHTMVEQTVSTGWRKIVVYVLYGVLVLLLLVLLMVTGIKFSQLNKEITDVKHHLEKISHGGGTSSARVQDVYLEATVPVRGTCREGWVSFQRNCYLLSTHTVIWSKAEEQCRAHGGHLLVLNSVEELDYISEIVEIRYDYWIGLVERPHQAYWSWVDGTDFSSTQTFWDEGQPDDWDYRENGEDCGQLHSSSKRKRKLWNDADCQLAYRYICETRA